MRRPPSGAESIDRLRRGELTVMAGGLFAIVAVLALLVHGARLPMRVDRAGSAIVDSFRAPRQLAIDLGRLQLATLFPRLVAYGSILFAAVLVLGLMTMAWWRGDPWAALLSIVAPMLAVILVDVLAKPLVGRYHGAALAFPSGHATGAAATAALVLVLVNRWYGWRCALRWMPVVAVLPLAVGTGVVRLGWHYPTDVVGGVAFGAAVVVALAAAIPGPTPVRVS